MWLTLEKWGKKMYLKYVQIVNYKNLKSSVLNFNKGANTIVGENDSGKSNAMNAVRILLDSAYFYNAKRLKESDFTESLGDWRGHWIIISSFFDEITAKDEENEICAQLVPEKENVDFLKSFIRCENNNYGTVTLFIRPIKKIRNALFKAENKKEFDDIRESITLMDYEFYYTSRSQADFTNEDLYKQLVGDLDNGKYADPDVTDLMILGERIDILNVWQHISLVFIDALRDVESELRKPRNPIRRVFDVIRNDVCKESKDEIIKKIQELNSIISSIPQISDIGNKVNGKLNEIVGLVYSPDISIESKLREDIDSLAKYLSIAPEGNENIELLGLGHLNILYIALKLVEFDYSRNHEILNIMIIEEPEAHIHTHIQKTLFDNLKIAKEYTQVIMTTHSTQLSEVSDIKNVNVFKINNGVTEIMCPTKGLDKFGETKLSIKDLSLSTCLERYLDAKRSVLLFSKGILLVEGDGEEILIPSLIKNIFGISLDELGIGIVNVGSVGFENIAAIFSPERLRRHCSIITDSDTEVNGANKSSAAAAKLAESRKKKLDNLFKTNAWVDMFYAPHTFEVDFANIDDNREYIKEIIKSHYKQESTIKKHCANIDSNDADRYDSVLTIAREIGKGWYSTLLASKINCSAIIPDYILEAVVFASQEAVCSDVLWKMFVYSLNGYVDDDANKFKKDIEKIKTQEDKQCAILKFVREYPDDMFSVFYLKREELLNEI